MTIAGTQRVMYLASTRPDSVVRHTVLNDVTQRRMTSRCTT